MKTLLKVLSILLIIGAVISIIMGVVGIIGGGAVIGSDLDLNTDEGAVAAVVGAMALVLGIAAIVTAIFNLLTGIFGWMGANGNQGKRKTALVMGWISLVLSVISVISAISQGTNVGSQLVSLILPLLFVIAATYAKKNHSLDA